jgi:hypothetical protein
VLLAGLLQLDPGVESRWPWAGGWYLPVGDSFQVGAPRSGEAPYLVTRNVATGTPGAHSGADLSNRSGGGLVRAAANGLVVLAGTGEDPGGFGVHVVLAHRLPDGSLVYSVYAHLARGTVAVHPGHVVAAGEPLGRVGNTGRATSPHLHFEVRIPVAAGERWEKAPPVDPVAFVIARSPRSAADTTWARPWLMWGESAALVDGTRPGLGTATRGEWWCALAAALALPDDHAHLDPARARAQLAEAGLTVGDADIDAPISAAEASADLERARRADWRLPAAPAERDSLALVQKTQLGSRDPLDDARHHRLADAPLTRAGMCLLLAGLAPEPRPAESRAVRD